MNCYCLVADLLGFRNINLNLTGVDLDRRVHQWADLTSALIDKHDIPYFQLISDTMFAGTAKSETGLASLISLSRDLLEAGIDSFLPLRGAIAQGTVTWGDHVTYGEAIVRAYELSNQQNWLGICLDVNMDHAGALWGFERIVLYPPPMKAGIIRLRPVIAWDVPSSQTLSRCMTGLGLTYEGEAMSYEWADKFQNTLIFRRYLQIARRQGDATQFYGVSPIEILDLE